VEDLGWRVRLVDKPWKATPPAMSNDVKLVTASAAFSCPLSTSQDA
jgi:hypothetical protein